MYVAPGENGNVYGVPGVPGVYGVTGAPNVQTTACMNHIGAMVLRPCVLGATLHDASTDIIRIWVAVVVFYLFHFWLFLFFLQCVEDRNPNGRG